MHLLFLGISFTWFRCENRVGYECECFLNFGRNMLGADFPSILFMKTAVSKMSSLYTFKILLDLNNSLACSKLVLRIYFQVPSACASPRDAAITVNIQVVKW